MAEFLTSTPDIRQTKVEGIWYTLQNQLFKDDDGRIFLAPRCTLTDGYSIPKIFHPIAGGMFQHNISPAVQHDWECYYHLAIVVNLNTIQLRKSRLLKYENDIWVCDDIPLEYLTFVETTFDETNDRFRRMLKCLRNIPKWQRTLIGNSVNLNIGWMKNPCELHKDRLYRIDYSQIRR